MINLKQLEELKAKGLIRDYTDSRKTGEKDSMKDGRVTKRKGQKIKDWIQLNLEHWCDAHKLELWCAGNEKGEFLFDPERRWRFDWAIPKKKLAFEYEGINSTKSRHTTKTGYTGDTEKYTEAAIQGWRVLRYTSINYKDLLKDLNKLV